jgi:toxin YoeB
MKLAWTRNFSRQYCRWSLVNSKIRIKIDQLIDAILADPTTGIGRPERLRKDGNYYSRRIDEKHRLVYRLNKESATIHLLRCHGHYDDH